MSWGMKSSKPDVCALILVPELECKSQHFTPRESREILTTPGSICTGPRSDSASACSRLQHGACGSTTVRNSDRGNSRNRD